jgi:poly-beta-1,6-N-acetyl-D-glucosamine synthase
MTPIRQNGAKMKFVLITPARNEADFIGLTLASVCAQTVLPERWVIVDDGSTDRTAEIVQEYTRQHPWIELVQRPRRAERNFAGKVHAFNAGFERVKSLPYEVIGNLDADVSFEKDYFEFLIDRFGSTPRLGVAGTAMREAGYDAVKDSFFNGADVFGACQLFRRACFEDVGGYTPIKWGGIDWVAVHMARLKGWETRCFTEKIFHHHRPMGATESNVWRARFDYGRKDYFLGNHPLWQVFRISYQAMKQPYVLGSLILFCGYAYPLIRRVERPIPEELLKFHRKEQIERLKQLWLNLVKTRKLKLQS